MVCSIDGCGRPLAARGWCKLHYYRWKRRGDPLRVRGDEPILQRIMARLPLPLDLDACWEAGGARVPDGYAIISVKGRPYGIHRIMFWLAHGWCPPVVMHVCDNPPCANPLHLQAGTRAENFRDMVMKGRHGVGEKNGRAKITKADAEAIRQRTSLGESRAALAAEYGLTYGRISQIVRGEGWS